MRQHSRTIGLLLERLGVASCDSDDAQQRVWLTAWRYFDRIRPGCERAFLLAVARREAGHTRRSYRRRSGATEVDVDELVSAALPADEWLARRQRLAEVSAVLQEMDAGLRVVFLLFELDETPTREIAKFLRIPVGTAKSRLRRARAEFLRHERRPPRVPKP